MVLYINSVTSLGVVVQRLALMQWDHDYFSIWSLLNPTASIHNYWLLPYGPTICYLGMGIFYFRCQYIVINYYLARILISHAHVQGCFFSELCGGLPKPGAPGFRGWGSIYFSYQLILDILLRNPVQWLFLQKIPHSGINFFFLPQKYPYELKVINQSTKHITT